MMSNQDTTGEIEPDEKVVAVFEDTSNCFSHAGKGANQRPKQGFAACRKKTPKKAHLLFGQRSPVIRG